MPGKNRPSRRKENRRRGATKPCPCGCGAPWLFGQGHEHRVHRPGQWNAHEPAWYAERERRRA